MKLSKVFAGFFALVLSAAGLLPASAFTVPDGNFIPPTAGEFIGNDFLVVEMEEQQRVQESRAFVQVFGPENKVNKYVCHDLVKDGCLAAVSEGSRKFVEINLTLPVCESASDAECIDSVAIYQAGQSPSPARFVRSVEGNTWPAFPEYNLPRGGTASIWSQPEAPHSAGTTNYAVSVQLLAGFGSVVQFKVSGFVANVTPFSDWRSSHLVTPTCQQGAAGQWETDFVTCRHPFASCVWTEGGVCGAAVHFSPGSRVKLSIRGSNTISGWFSGRVQDPFIDVTPISATQNLISVDASPIVTPLLKAAVRSSTATPEIKALFADCIELRTTGNCWTFADSRSRRSVQMVSAYRSAVGDAATYSRNPWFIRSEAPLVGNRVGNPCLASNNRVLGIIATNAMVYQSGVPDFSRGYLDYWVAGMHYEPDKKTPFLGTYDLVMRSDVARCLYGFSKAPIKASITVTGPGETNVATKVVSESNGWLKLAAYGFTFSEKNIQVKLTQAQSRTLTKSTARTVTLTSKQRAEVKAVLAKSSGNTKFICTGTFVRPADRALALQRARAACNYAKAQNKNYSFFAQAKVTKAASFDGRVMLNSK
jgi:hypothetical protein